jgi:hypothetical protein
MALLGCEKAPSVGFEISFEQPAPTLTASNGFASWVAAGVNLAMSGPHFCVLILFLVFFVFG